MEFCPISNQLYPVTGTAGWNIPKSHAELFPGEASHLERYSAVLPCVEINSSFYREHLPKTYARWRESTPEGFLFAVKLHQRFTHELRLKVEPALLAENLQSIQELGEKWGALLVQLPPSVRYEKTIARNFFGILRQIYSGPVAVEPRHPTWKESLETFREFGLTKVRADPEPCPVENPTDWEKGGVVYCRLHGSPEIYKSNYTPSFLRHLSPALSANPRAWCIFDNTTFGHAWKNAVEMKHLLRAQASERAAS